MGIPLGQQCVFLFFFFFFFFFSFFAFRSFYPMIRGGILIYVSPDISRGYDFNYLYVPLAQSNLFYRATASLTSPYT